LFSDSWLERHCKGVHPKKGRAGGRGRREE
jgi:hypothetical protein